MRQSAYAKSAAELRMKPQAPEDIPPVSAKFPRATQKSCLHSASEFKAVRLFIMYALNEIESFKSLILRIDLCMKMMTSPNSSEVRT